MKDKKEIIKLMKELNVTIKNLGEVGHPELETVSKNYVTLRLQDKEAGFFYFGQTPSREGLLIAMFVLADDTNRDFKKFLEYTSFQDNSGSRYYYRIGTRYRQILHKLLGENYTAFRNKLYLLHNIKNKTLIDKTNITFKQLDTNDTKIIVKYNNKQFTTHLTLNSNNDANTIWTYLLSILRNDNLSFETNLKAKKGNYESKGQLLTFQNLMREVHTVREGFKRVYGNDYSQLVSDLAANNNKAA